MRLDGVETLRLASAAGFVGLIVSFLATLAAEASGVAVDALLPWVFGGVSALVVAASIWRPGARTRIDVSETEIRWKMGWVEHLVVRESGWAVHVDPNTGDLHVGTDLIGRVDGPTAFSQTLRSKGWR